MEEQILYKGFYVVKKITIKPGCGTLLQYHKKRVKTIVVQKGTLCIETEEKKEEIKSGQFVHIKKEVKHKIYNETNKDLILIESSTNDLEDIVEMKSDKKE